MVDHSGKYTLLSLDKATDCSISITPTWLQLSSDLSLLQTQVTYFIYGFIFMASNYSVCFISRNSVVRSTQHPIILGKCQAYYKEI